MADGSLVVKLEESAWIVDAEEGAVRSRWATREQAVMAADRMAAARGGARIVVQACDATVEADYRYGRPDVQV